MNGRFLKYFLTIALSLIAISYLYHIYLYKKHIEDNRIVRQACAYDANSSAGQSIRNHEHFDALMNCVNIFFDKKEMDALVFARPYNQYTKFDVDIDRSLTSIKDDKYILSINDMGAYYAIKFKGGYHYSPIIGFSIDKTGTLRYPYIDTKTDY